jgi:hypothetical protein
MAKIYATDGKLIADGFPQIQIGDKLFKVDNRKSTYDACQKAVEKAKGNEERVILEYCLGKEQLKEIDAMDLTIKGFMNLLTYVQAALFDITFEEAEARFQKAQQ